MELPSSQPHLISWNSKGCSQQINVQVETNEECLSSGVSSGTSAVEHTCWQHGQWDQCTFSQFAKDTKLCSAADMLRGRDVVKDNLTRLERWVYGNLMKFSQAKYKLPHLSALQRMILGCWTRSLA